MAPQNAPQLPLLGLRFRVFWASALDVSGKSSPSVTSSKTAATCSSSALTCNEIVECGWRRSGHLINNHAFSSAAGPQTCEPMHNFNCFPFPPPPPNNQQQCFALHRLNACPVQGLKFDDRAEVADEPHTPPAPAQPAPPLHCSHHPAKLH